MPYRPALNDIDKQDQHRVYKKMAMKRGRQFKPVLMELKALFKKERCLIPQSHHPESEFEGKILLGCELLRSYMRQKTKTRRKDSCKKFEYSDFIICGLFEKENRLLYGDFLELGFERGVMFVGEYQWRLTTERRVCLALLVEAHHTSVARHT